MIASALTHNVASDATVRAADTAPASDTQPRATELDDMIAELVTISLSSERPPGDELAQDEEGAEKDALCREQMVASAAPPTPRVGAADLAWLASQTTDEAVGSPSEMTPLATSGREPTSLGWGRDEPLPPTVRVPSAPRAAALAELGGARATDDLAWTPADDDASTARTADAGAMAASATALAPPDDPFVEPPPSSGPVARSLRAVDREPSPVASKVVVTAPTESDKAATPRRPEPARRHPTPVSTRATTVTPPANATAAARAPRAEAATRADASVLPGPALREPGPAAARPAAAVDATPAAARRELAPAATAGLYREIREVRAPRDATAPAGDTNIGALTAPDDPFAVTGAAATTTEHGATDDEEQARGEPQDSAAHVEGRAEGRQHVGAAGHASARELHRHIDHTRGASEVRDARELENAKIELERGGAARGTIDLHDAGRVEVLATRHEGNLEVRVDAQREAVAHVLAVEAPRLSVELSTAGIDARVLVGEGGAGGQPRRHGDAPRDPDDTPRDGGAAQSRMHPASNRKNRFVL